MDAADQLNDDVAVVDDRDRVGRQQTMVDAGTRFVDVADENPGDAQMTESLLLEQSNESLSDRSASEEADAHFAHASLLATRACSRSSMRSAASSRPTDNRISPS